MRVTLRWEAEAKRQLVAWQLSLPGTPLDQQLFAETLVEVFRQRVVPAGGQLADAILDRSVVPPLHWCELTGRTWVGYTVESAGVLRRSRLIRVWRLRDGPPPASPPGALPS